MCVCISLPNSVLTTNELSDLIVLILKLILQMIPIITKTSKIYNKNS